jgi:hypothetical protein
LRVGRKEEREAGYVEECAVYMHFFRRENNNARAKEGLSVMQPKVVEQIKKVNEQMQTCIDKIAT